MAWVPARRVSEERRRAWRQGVQVLRPRALQAWLRQVRRAYRQRTWFLIEPIQRV